MTDNVPPSDFNPFIQGIYNISSKSGELLGSVCANFINYSTKATTVGLEAFRQGNSKFINNVGPTYEKSKETILSKINEISSTNSTEKK